MTRIEGFRSEYKDFKEEFRQLKLQREESVYNSNRSELLERRTAHHHHQGDSGTGTPENPYGDSSNVNSSGRPQYTNIPRQEGLTRERDALGRAGAQLDEFLERGKMVLGDLGEQREMLKGAQRRIYSVANTLGVSTDTIRLVERRATEDKRIFYGGIVVMLVCFYYILRWFG